MNKRPVLLYGASGFSGRLIAEFLREYNVPFIAAGRNQGKIREVMATFPGSRRRTTKSQKSRTQSTNLRNSSLAPKSSATPLAHLFTTARPSSKPA